MAENCLEITPVQDYNKADLFQCVFDSDVLSSSENKLQLLLVTDPICSTAWSFEGELRRLMLEYGHMIDFRVLMGGLLRSWVDFDRGGINKASDVFCHWKDVGEHFSVPLSAEVWKRDPLSSSFPSSKAVICAFLQGNDFGFKLLRVLREAVFIFDQNISKMDILIEKANFVGLDIAKFMNDYNNYASFILEDDVQKSKDLGVKLLPTVILSNKQKKRFKIEANLDYACLESMVYKLMPEVSKQHYDTSVISLISKYNSLSTKEVTVLSQQSWARSEQELNQLRELGLVDLMEFSTGNFWIKKG